MPETLEILLLLLGTILGGAIGWLIASQKMNQNVARAEARADAQSEANRDAQAQYKALAADALRANSEQFLQLAGETLKVEQKDAEMALESRKVAVEAMITPLKEQLATLTKANQEMDKARQGAYSGIKRHLELLQSKTEMLGERADNLTNALTTSSQARGNWGEVKLRRLLEIAGMTEHVDFFEQETVEGGRPDVVIRLPNQGTIPIDSKATAKHFLEALDADSEEDENALVMRHAAGMRSRVQELGSKAYQEKLEGDIDYVIMFVPSEALLAAAFEMDPDLHEYALSKNVLIATPVTLLALLRTVAIYWQQQSLAENASEIYEHSREMYKRTTVLIDHMQKVGSNLEKASKAYNATMKSYESRILPHARKLENLKVAETLQAKFPESTEVITMPEDFVEVEGEEEE